MRTRRGGFGAVALCYPIGKRTQLIEDVPWHSVGTAVFYLINMGGDVLGSRFSIAFAKPAIGEANEDPRI